MAFDFPNAPSLNQQVTQGTITYTWNGIVWLAGQAGIINVAFGGTGDSTIALGNILMGNGSNAIVLIAPGTTGNVLTSNGNVWSSQAGASGGGPAYDQANTARNTANTAQTTAVAAFGQANT